jgi:hypothetical protein
MFGIPFSKTVSLFLNQKIWVPSKFFMFSTSVSSFNLKTRFFFFFVWVPCHFSERPGHVLAFFKIGFVFLILLPLPIIFTVTPLITFTHLCLSSLPHTEHESLSPPLHTTLIYAYPHSLSNYPNGFI